MKTTLKISKISAKVGKVLIFFFLTVCLSATTLHAQNFKKFAFGPGLSINVGVFNPEEINQYIATALNDYTIVFGNTDLIMYYELSGCLNFKTRWVDVSPTFTYAIAPKIIVGAQSFYFTRISPGVLANFFIPTGMSGKTALFIGGGIQYHMMKFEEYEGNNIGFKVQLGYDLQFGNFNMQPVLAFNIATAAGQIPQYPSSTLDMNYTGGQIGINMSFHKPVSHRRF
jgi:hypothetical protein